MDASGEHHINNQSQKDKEHGFDTYLDLRFYIKTQNWVGQQKEYWRKDREER